MGRFLDQAGLLFEQQTATSPEKPTNWDTKIVPNDDFFSCDHISYQGLTDDTMEELNLADDEVFSVATKCQVSE